MQQRIALLLKEENLTSGKLAERLGVQPSSISHVIAGRNKPGFEFIVSVLRNFPRINPDWLILGEGEMYRREEAPASNFEGNPPLLESLDESQTIKKELSLSNTTENPDNTSRKSEERKPEEPQMIPEKQQASDNQIVKIVIFHTDRTFSAYTESPFI